MPPFSHPAPAAGYVDLEPAAGHTVADDEDGAQVDAMCSFDRPERLAGIADPVEFDRFENKRRGVTVEDCPLRSNVGDASSALVDGIARSEGTASGLCTDGASTRLRSTSL